MAGRDELLNTLIELKRNYKDKSILHWYTFEFGKWQWWLSASLIVVPLYIWWKIVDRRRIYEILSYGLLVNIFSTFLDVAGSELVLWVYPIRLLPHIPRLFPIDFIVIPVVFMIVYQKYGDWKQYAIASIVISLVFSFAAEPLLVWMHLYKLISWRYIYSFPIYIAIAIICKWAVNWFKTKKPVDEYSG